MQLFRSGSEFIDLAEMRGSHLPNLPVSERRVDTQMIEGKPIQSLQSKMQGYVIIKRMFRVQFVIESFADLEFYVFLEPILVF